MIEINDEESLKRENITIELFTKDFIQKPINLKNKIEKEINEINNRYNITKNKINKKFKEEHEKLIIEENNLIENLQNEVKIVSFIIQVMDQLLMILLFMIIFHVNYIFLVVIKMF